MAEKNWAAVRATPQDLPGLLLARPGCLIPSGPGRRHPLRPVPDRVPVPGWSEVPDPARGVRRRRPARDPVAAQRPVPGTGPGPRHPGHGAPHISATTPPTPTARSSPSTSRDHEPAYGGGFVRGVIRVARGSRRPRSTTHSSDTEFPQASWWTSTATAARGWRVRAATVAKRRAHHVHYLHFRPNAPVDARGVATRRPVGRFPARLNHQPACAPGAVHSRGLSGRA